MKYKLFDKPGFTYNYRALLLYPHTYILGDILSDVFIPNGGSHSCRETFQKNFLRKIREQGSKTINFALTVNSLCKIDGFRRFVQEMENKLDIKDSIIVSETEEKNLYIITLNSYWIESKIRQEFVTIFLRCYSEWVKNKGADNSNELKSLPFEEIIFSQKYFKESKEATLHFLKGYTSMKKPFKADIGWYNRFVGKQDNGNPSEVLVKVNQGVADFDED